MDKVNKAKEQSTEKLLSKQNVCGTAVGYKWKEGKPTDEPAVLVFVQKKVKHDPSAISKFSTKDLIPEEINGVKTDVIEVGDLVKQFKQKARPLRPGFSCGHPNITAGTMGGFFLDSDDDLVMLTNNHVAADENRAKIGDEIYQPGMSDTRIRSSFGGWNHDPTKLPYFGTLKKYVKLKHKNNTQDSAIVKVHKKFIDKNLIDHIYPTVNKPLQEFADPKVKMQVQKCGRTTGYTTGQIIGVNASFSIAYDFGTARFDDCIVTTAMSKGGDSGSIICDMQMNAVGLLFAGSKKVTLANPIKPVVAHYGLQIWTGNGLKKPPVVKPGHTDNLDSDHWEEFTNNGKIKYQNSGQTAVMTDNGNQYCFLQSRLGNFKSVSCEINTGNDGGATWGPGIVVQWPTGMLKVNLRKGGSFGGYFNTNPNLSVGKTKPNTSYVVRIRKTSNSYIGEVKDSNKWYTVIEVPLSVFAMEPTFLRIGKTSKKGSAYDYAASGNRAGKVGTCTISNLRVD